METINPEITPSSGVAVLDDVATFIRKYLVCDDHQLTILTLWSACARQCYGFRTAPYLAIRSPEPHCGKSICLFLLHSLGGPNTIFYTGVAAPALMRRIAVGRTFEELEKELEEEKTCDTRVMTLLLDDCHHTFGPSERQPLLGLINSGSECTGLYPVGDDENYFFGPKAFAGNAPLPRSLVSRCIPIVLRRPRSTEKITRFNHSPVIDAGKALASHLKQWLELNYTRLSEAADEEPPDTPVTLSPGQRQCAEPLIHIADLAGGAWPTKVRAALAAVFDPADGSPQLQMLWDVRSIFRAKNNPEHLATSDLLSQLSNMDHRPWSEWGAKSGKRLAAYLRPFGILSHRLHISSADDFMGYLLKDFQDAWARYLPPSSSGPLEDAGNLAEQNTVRGGTIPPSPQLSSTQISAIGAD
jgi:hypothetical protein